MGVLKRSQGHCTAHNPRNDNSLSVISRRQIDKRSGREVAALIQLGVICITMKSNVLFPKDVAEG